MVAARKVSYDEKRECLIQAIVEAHMDADFSRKDIIGMVHSIYDVPWHYGVSRRQREEFVEAGRQSNWHRDGWKWSDV